jgi:hypothetical protein
MRRIFGSKKEVKGGWIKQHNEELHNLHIFPLNIIRVLKSKRMTWMGHVPRMRREEINIKFWWEKMKGRSSLEGLGKYNIKTYVKQIGVLGYGMDSCGSRSGFRVGFYCHGNESQSTICSYLSTWLTYCWNCCSPQIHVLAFISFIIDYSKWLLICAFIYLWLI